MRLVGDMHDRVAALRVAQQFYGPARGIQTRLGCPLAHPREQFLVDAVCILLVLGILKLVVGVLVEVGALVTDREWTQVRERVSVIVAEVALVELIIPVRDIPIRHSQLPN
jgi:hypothetical protein